MEVIANEDELQSLSANGDETRSGLVPDHVRKKYGQILLERTCGIKQIEGENPYISEGYKTRLKEKFGAYKRLRVVEPGYEIQYFYNEAKKIVDKEREEKEKAESEKLREAGEAMEAARMKINATET